MLKKWIALILLTVFTSACAQQAAFLSEPPGARVLVDGELVGTTPCSYNYVLSAGSRYEVTLEKEGYQTVRHIVHADEVDRGAREKLVAAGMVIPGGSALLVGALFTKKLKENYEFVLKQSSAQLAAQVPAGALSRL